MWTILHAMLASMASTTSVYLSSHKILSSCGHYHLRHHGWIRVASITVEFYHRLRGTAEVRLEFFIAWILFPR